MNESAQRRVSQRGVAASGRRQPPLEVAASRDLDWGAVRRVTSALRCPLGRCPLGDIPPQDCCHDCCPDGRCPPWLCLG